MDKYYTLNDLALMTGLTTRTLRNYLKMGLLRGERIDGIWNFTEEEIAEFFDNPYVISGVQAKNRAIVFDFLEQNKKQHNEICTIIDLYIEQKEAKEISGFFCEKVGKRNEERIKVTCERNGAYLRVILRGPDDSVMEILNAYYHSR